MTKKERVIGAIHGEAVDGIPSGFSLHFPAERAFGDAGVKSHLQFFEETDTDILKIMNENLVPYMGEIRCAKDFAMIKTISIQDTYMQNQIEMTQKILDQCGDSGFTMGTLHGVTASSIHPLEQLGMDYHAARTCLTQLLREDEKPVLEGIKRITDGMCQLAQKYIELGVDSVYYAALGGEVRYLTDEEFERWVKPYDHMIMGAIKEAGGYCFTHICKDGLNMNRYQDYASLSDVINWGVYEAPFSMEQGRELFPEKTLMGGLPNRSGVLVEGSEEEIREAVQEVIKRNGGNRFILGADCTLDTKQDLRKIRVAVEASRGLTSLIKNDIL